MRAWPLLVILLLGCSSGGETAPRAADALDCEWVKGDSNCWRTMAKALEVCLGGTETDTGTLAKDGLSCTYDKGRTITSTSKLGSTDSSLSPTRDFVVKNDAGTQCVHVQESADVLTVTYADGALRLSTVGDRVEVTCPSGSVFKGADADLRGCLSPSSGVPGYAWSSNATPTTDATRATFALLGMTIPLYACAAL